MILFALVISGCGSLNEVPDRDTQGLASGDSSAPSDTAGTTGTTGTDTFTDTVEADPDAPVVGSCDAHCWYHTTGEQFYEWGIDCTATDPDGAKNIWNGRWSCTGGACEDQSGLVACTANSGICSSSFKEAQITPAILCEQADTYEFTIWVSDWEGHESRGYRVTGRQD